MQWRWWYLGFAVCMTIFYCEFLGDYVTLLQCSWPPQPNDETNKSVELRALILADPHLLGPLRGHWLDKLYREWHMQRAFQAAMSLLRPEVVFVLGDIFDEGEFVGDGQFREYVRRFQQHFRTPAGTPIVSVVGNHDVGFHYKMSPVLIERFEKQFNNTGAHLYTFKGAVHFVFLNSMAMKNDGCHFCESTQRDLQGISSKLACLRRPQSCKNANAVIDQHGSYSRPIIMQHFPTYRHSDKSCREFDAPTVEKFRENWEVLSKESTALLGTLLQPRLAFAGHSHHYCYSINRLGIEEYTVASFSWRNKINPSFLLATFTATQHAVAKCDMLKQQIVYSIYITIAIGCALISIYRMCCILLNAKTTNTKIIKNM